MKSLYESLLDDFDVIADKQDNDTLEQAFEEADTAAGIKNKMFMVGRDLTFSGEEAQTWSRVEDGIYKCGIVANYKYNKYVKAAMDKIKLMQPFNEIWVLKNFDVTAKTINKDLAETINIYNGCLVMREVQEINGVTINIGINKDYVSSSFELNLGKLVIKNSTITHPKGVGYGAQYQMLLGDIPEISNSRIEGYKMVKVYSPSVIRDRKDNKLTNMFDPTYKAYYHDAKLGALKDYTKKGDFKTVCAIVNNPKKYKFVETDEQKCMFKMNPSFKLKDVINIDCFDNELERISIMDNNVVVLFTKGRPIQGSICGWSACMPWNTAKLPNDNWYISIVKK